MNENKTNINCEKLFYINIYSHHWQYCIFNSEIFTFFIENKRGENYDYRETKNFRFRNYR